MTKGLYKITGTPVKEKNKTFIIIAIIAAILFIKK